MAPEPPDDATVDKKRVIPEEHLRSHFGNRRKKEKMSLTGWLTGGWLSLHGRFPLFGD